MPKIDREGIFKARPTGWSVREPKEDSNSQSVGISIEWAIVSQFVASGEDWLDWTQYGEYIAQGDHYVVKVDGSVNQTTVDQLVKAGVWDGSLELAEFPPDVVAQVTVKNEEWQGESRFKVTWVNPGDHVPKARGASPETVTKLKTRYGSLLRAAAGHAKKDAPPVAAAPPRPPRVAQHPGQDGEPPASVVTGGPVGKDDDLPSDAPESTNTVGAAN